MTMDPPLGSSTVVSALRTRRPGIAMVLAPAPTPMAFSLVNSLTSTEIRSEMRPSDSTTGVKPRPTPNGLNSMVISLSVRPIGTGNSPPARNLALSPEIAAVQKKIGPHVGFPSEQKLILGTNPAVAHLAERRRVAVAGTA